MNSRHPNEFLKSKFANGGRIRGMGINEDNYDYDETYVNKRPQARICHKIDADEMNGPVVIYRVRKDNNENA